MAKIADKENKKISFGTKAETLSRLKDLVRDSVVDELLVFTVRDWQERPRQILDQIKKKFDKGPVIVRSSARNEDCFEYSNAGHFRSVGNIPMQEDGLGRAINEVISSYADGKKDHHVFIQKFLRSVEMSGVVFTRDLSTFAPYFIVNYDDTSGAADTVTSGKGRNVKTYVAFKETDGYAIDPRFIKILKAAKELEKLFDYDALDIEFIYHQGVTHILQVRPLARRKGQFVPDASLISSTLKQIYERISEASLTHPDLYGKKTLYGIMPDWNPAEMIGIKPRPLAMSLYRELITDNIWAYQRDNYGYKRLRSFPLMVSFAGHPYIDVRVDFNSFIPKALDDVLSHKLADFYLNKLQSLPASHDKVEFDIVYSCYTLDLKERLHELLAHGFTPQELEQIKKALLDLTNNIIRPGGLYKEDLKKVGQLEERKKRLLSSNLSSIHKIYWLVEDCKRYGTLPFAGIARAAFIAMQFLDSIVEKGIITLVEKNKFLGSLKTIAKQLSLDTKRLAAGQLSLEKFLEIYGHLRPGTYDILSESYRENFEKYFNLNSAPVQTGEETEEKFAFTEQQLQKIDKLLQNHNLQISAKGFFTFVKEAVEGREYAKFIFTKNIDDILSYIKAYGRSLDFKPEEMSFVEISTLLKLYSTVAFFDEKELLAQEIQRNRVVYQVHQSLKLPHLICEPGDIYQFHLSGMEPNFITTRTVMANTASLTPEAQKNELAGKIVLIESADPGFDWLFSHSIKGLITMYGGANSHMAIRAAELGIPAVIGCGPVLFEEWSREKKLEIDCLNKRVIAI